ncbi:MAG: sigma-70 family RNA polymerase sigma factor [Gammaproteobacteria bacterium]
MELHEFKEDKLWDLFKNHNNLSAREKLIQNYIPLSKKIAATLYALRYDDDIEFNDYLQYGHIGLVESIDRFDPGRNILFNTFASYRINGSILNGISKLTEKREQISMQNRLRNERMKSLTKTDDKLSTSLFENIADTTVGLAISFMLEDTQLIQFSEKESIATPYSVSVMGQLQQDVIQAIELLSDSERHIINSHYFKFISFNVIANDLGVTKGRVSQLHKRAITKLREYLQSNNMVDTEY